MVAFRHLSGMGQAISVADGPLNVQLQSNVGATVLLTNAGNSLCYVEFGPTSATTRATTAGLPVLANSAYTISRDVINDLFCSAVCDSGASTTLKITPGTGD